MKPSQEKSIDDWVRLKKEQLDEESVPPRFQQDVMNAIRAQELPSIAVELPKLPLPAPLSTPCCVALGIAKVHLILQLIS
ncbi:MAG: hypothetical protein ACSHYB_00900 [Roseibacillus sp.]